ncbi:hypothetical protein PUN28_003507 [Cardiocondyla obscurior]|uniref:Uncharacterized protein n=1 Tax=Cardiocondyla obscurior TaxID=286306 RepID=A0AAW2GM13_9HYME
MRNRGAISFLSRYHRTVLNPRVLELNVAISAASSFSSSSSLFFFSIIFISINSVRNSHAASASPRRNRTVHLRRLILPMRQCREGARLFTSYVLHGAALPAKERLVAHARSCQPVCMENARARHATCTYDAVGVAQGCAIRAPVIGLLAPVSHSVPRGANSSPPRTLHTPWYTPSRVGEHTDSPHLLPSSSSSPLAESHREKKRERKRERSKARERGAEGKVHFYSLPRRSERFNDVCSSTEVPGFTQDGIYSCYKILLCH